MKNIVDVNAFTSPVQVLEDGDPVVGSETETSVQALANRTAFLQTALNVDANKTIQLIGGAAATKATITSSGSNGHEGVNAGGHGTASGVAATGGATGPGVTATGGVTSGAGVVATATGGNSNGVTATGFGTASGVAATGGATGPGVTATGGATSGAGIVATATGGNSNGVTATGHGTAAGITTTGGSTNGAGLSAFGGGAGNGVEGTSTTGDGIYGTGTNGVHGVTAASGGAGVRGEAAAAGKALQAVGSSTAIGLEVDVASGRGIYINGGSVLAPLFITPQAAVPSGASVIGDLYMTTAGVLKVCTVAGTGGGATWVSVGAQV